MKHLKTLAKVALVSCTILIVATGARAERLSLNPTSWDFGEVEVGASGSATFNLSSLGPTAVWFYVIQVTPDATDAEICGQDGITCDFSVTSAPGLPLELPDGESVAVDVEFAPSAPGPREAYLNIVSNDAEAHDNLFLPLTGVGVEPPSGDPAALMADLIAFFRDAMDAGTAWGAGPGSSARHRLDAFGHQLMAAASLIDRGADGLACDALLAARAKADGESRPADFVAGPAAGELVVRIDAVREALGCP